MSPADKLVPHLARVKRTGPSKWIACCPAHDDGSPSLAIRELDDGRLLLHCFGGCSAEAVVAAVSLNLADLFPASNGEVGMGHKPQRRPWSAADLIDLAAHEATVAMVIACDLLHERPEVDIQRLLIAAGRLADIKEAVHASR